MAKWATGLIEIKEGYVLTSMSDLLPLWASYGACRRCWPWAVGGEVLCHVSDRDAQHCSSTRNVLQGLKTGGWNYTFCTILMKDRGWNMTFSSFLLRYRGGNYTNFPETWKRGGGGGGGGSKWWSICSNLHIVSTHHPPTPTPRGAVQKTSSLIKLYRYQFVVVPTAITMGRISYVLFLLALWAKIIRILWSYRAPCWLLLGHLSGCSSATYALGVWDFFHEILRK